MSYDITQGSGPLALTQVPASVYEPPHHASAAGPQLSAGISAMYRKPDAWETTHEPEPSHPSLLCQTKTRFPTKTALDISKQKQNKTEQETVLPRLSYSVNKWWVKIQEWSSASALMDDLSKSAHLSVTTCLFCRTLNSPPFHRGSEAISSSFCTWI